MLIQSGVVDANAIEDAEHFDGFATLARVLVFEGALLGAIGKEHDKVCPVADYIRRNIGPLAQEHTDGIW